MGLLVHLLIHHIFLPVQQIHHIHTKYPTKPINRISANSYATYGYKHRKGQINMDNLGTWGTRLELPDIQMDKSIQHGKPVPIITADNIGFTSLIGRRETNEDRLRIEELEDLDIVYAAIFDGHGGSECAEYAKEHMHKHVIKHIRSGNTDLSNVLRRSFLSFNEEFSNYIGYHDSREYSFFIV